MKAGTARSKDERDLEAMRDSEICSSNRWTQESPAMPKVHPLKEKHSHSLSDGLNGYQNAMPEEQFLILP